MASRYHRKEIQQADRSMEIGSSVGLYFAICLLWIIVGGIGSNSVAQTPQPVPLPVIPDGPAVETVLESLWRNNLYSIANDACQAQVKILPAGSDARIRWQCWLIRGLAGEAVDLEDRVPPDVEKGAEHWKQIDSILQEIDAIKPAPFRALWIRWQYLHGIHLRAQGAMARYLANPLDNASRDAALAAIRDLDRGAEELQKKIGQQVTGNAASTTVQARKQIRELQELSTETALLRCDALALRGQAYPFESADAIAAGTEMEQFALEAAGKIATDWSGRAKLDLAIAVAKWLQGNSAEALRRLQTLLQSDDSRVRQRALDLLVQCALQANLRSDAEAALSQFQSTKATPEYALAQMRLALYDLPQGEDTSSVRQQGLKDLLAARDSIGQRFGGYWQRRAEALLLSVTKTGGASSMNNAAEATELVRIEVRQLIAAQRFDEAVQKLLQQAGLLKRENGNALAIQLTLQAAALEQKQKKWKDARDLFRQAAVDYPEEKDAAAAHLMSIFCASQLVRSAPQDAELLKTLDELFIEQLKLFPNEISSIQAALQYSQSANARRIWSEAAGKLREQLAQVSFPHELVWLVVELDLRSIYWQFAEGDPRAVENTQVTVDAWQRWIDERPQDASGDSLRNLGGAGLVSIIDLLPESLMMRLTINEKWNGYRQTWLKAKFQEAEPSFAWKEIWQSISDIKQALREQRKVDEKSFQRLANWNLQREQQLAADSSTSKGLLPSIALWAAAEVITENIEMIEPTERWNSRATLSELHRLFRQATDHVSWSRAPADKSDGLIWRMGTVDKNRQQYLGALSEKIAAQPRVSNWQRIRALLLETGDAEELEEALGIYRRLAAGAKSGSDEWLRARYRSALCLLWLKKPEDARQTIEVILLTHPPKNPLWKARLEEFKEVK